MDEVTTTVADGKTEVARVEVMGLTQQQEQWRWHPCYQKYHF